MPPPLSSVIPEHAKALNMHVHGRSVTLTIFFWSPRQGYRYVMLSLLINLRCLWQQKLKKKEF